MNKIIHIIGGGLAGLSCAVKLLKNKKEKKITLYESSDLFGGRCRSYNDKDFECYLDNGNHLIIKAYQNTFKYLKEIKATHTITSNEKSFYPFIDIKNSEHWEVKPYSNFIPWWIFFPSCRPSGVSLLDFIKGCKLAFAKNDQTVSNLINVDSLIYKRFWKPFTIAVLNTHPKEASAKLLWKVILKTLFRWNNPLHPFVVKKSLNESLIKPGIEKIVRHGGKIKTNYRLKKINLENNCAKEIIFQNKTIPINNEDFLVLAIPPNVLSKILPDIVTPKKTNCILNVHFKLDKTNNKIIFPQESFFMGVIGGLTNWIFKKENILSITISAANNLNIYTNKKISKMIWSEIEKIFKLQKNNMPKYKIIREKMATFVQSPEEIFKKPKMLTNYSNIFLAGDWVDNGFPATIEGAITSGYNVAHHINKI